MPKLDKEWEGVILRSKYRMLLAFSGLACFALLTWGLFEVRWAFPKADWGPLVIVWFLCVVGMFALCCMISDRVDSVKPREYQSIGEKRGILKMRVLGWIYPLAFVPVVVVLRTTGLTVLEYAGLISFELLVWVFFLWRTSVIDSLKDECQD